MFQGSFKSVSRKFQGNFSGVSRKFQVCSSKIEGHVKYFRGGFQEFLRNFQESFMGISRKFQGKWNGVFSVFQWYLKEIQREFEGSFKSV